jgi:hypothetical protein
MAEMPWDIGDTAFERATDSLGRLDRQGTGRSLREYEKPEDQE